MIELLNPDSDEAVIGTYEFLAFCVRGDIVARSREGGRLVRWACEHVRDPSGDIPAPNAHDLDAMLDTMSKLDQIREIADGIMEHGQGILSVGEVATEIIGIIDGESATDEL